MTLSHLRICAKCHNSLRASGGEGALEWYIGICLYCIAGIPVYLRSGSEGTGDTLTHYLERNGYVVTTEVTDEVIKVVPVGHQKQNDIHMFCSKLADHAKKT